MTHLTLGLIFLTPLLWLLISVMIYKAWDFEKEGAGAAMVMGLFLTAASWGVYLMHVW